MTKGALRSARLYFVLPIIAGIGVSVSACSTQDGGITKSESGTVLGAVAGGLVGNQIGKGRGNVLATVAGAVVGGIVGSELGRGMDERDRQLAQAAEFDALERGQSGVSRQWKNPDNGRYGDVVPSKPYRRGANDCRDFTHTVYIDGRPQQMRGTACRNPDGTWQNVA